MSLCSPHDHTSSDPTNSSSTTACGATEGDRLGVDDHEPVMLTKAASMTHGGLRDYSAVEPRGGVRAAITILQLVENSTVDRVST